MGVTKEWRGRTAIQDIDLVVPKGTCLAIMGSNGSGKSTLLRVIAGAAPPDRGSLRVLGWDAAREPRQLRASVGVYMGDDRAWYWRLSGRRNLEFFASLHVDLDASQDRVDRALEVVRLDGHADRQVGEYSTGMRARLGLARALLRAAPVLVLDEPTRSLDAAGAIDLGAMLLDGVAREGTSVVLATHNPAEASALADQTVILDEGVISQRTYALASTRAAARPQW